MPQRCMSQLNAVENKCVPILIVGPGLDFLRVIGSHVWWLWALACIVALVRPKSRRMKVLALIIVNCLFCAWPVRWAWDNKLRSDAFVAKRDKAVAHWEERCKRAGIFIYRTVENVEGLYIGEIPEHPYDEADQNAPDVFNRDYSGDEYILSFLEGRNATGRAIIGGNIDPLNPLRDKNGGLLPEPIRHPGYRWVEGIDPKDGKRYRYSGVFELLPRATTAVDLVVKRNTPGDPPPRYAIRRTDISTPEDRALWIAGGSLQVVDQLSGEVLAERIGFMVDKGGMGSTAGARTPWDQARMYRCPQPITDNPLRPGNRYVEYQSRLLVERVLKIQGSTLYD